MPGFLDRQAAAVNRHAKSAWHAARNDDPAPACGQPELAMPAIRHESMCSMDNPYQASSHSAYPVASSGSVSPATLQALAGTKPWVRLCSILGFIGAGMMILAGLAVMATGVFGGMGSRQSAAMTGLPLVAAGIFYLLMALLYLFPSLKLWQYGSSIVRLMSSGSNADLEAALDQQRGFWKFVGIMMVILLGLMLLAFVGGFIAAMAGAAALSP
jgi:hypothetical protein